MKKRILITSGMEAFSQKIANLLSSDSLEIVFASSKQIPEILVKNGRYHRIPSPNEMTFVHQLLKTALDLGIDEILPLSQQEISRISSEISLFEEYGVHIRMPSTIELSTTETIVNPPKDLQLQLSSTGVYTYSDDQTKFLCLSE